MEMTNKTYYNQIVCCLAIRNSFFFNNEQLDKRFCKAIQIREFLHLMTLMIVKLLTCRCLKLKKNRIKYSHGKRGDENACT